MLTSDKSETGASAIFRSRSSKKQTDQHGYTIMTLDYLKELAVQQKGYRTPSLNDNLYLHYKGFHSISDAIHAYNGLKALWLEGNCLSSIDNLDCHPNLKCLYLQENCFTSINAEIQALTNLHTLNLSNNLITHLPNELKHLHNLSSLHVSQNRLGPDPDSIQVLAECVSLSVLDLHTNQLTNNTCLTEVLWKVPNLAVLTLHHNPLMNTFVQYRRNCILNMPKLTFLDDRPVSDNDRKVTVAWSVGGSEMEQAELVKIKQIETNKRELDFKVLADLQMEHRILVSGKDSDGIQTHVFSKVPKLVKFYNDMVNKGLGNVVQDAAPSSSSSRLVRSSDVPIRSSCTMDVSGTVQGPKSGHDLISRASSKLPLIEELSPDVSEHSAISERPNLESTADHLVCDETITEIPDVSGDESIVGRVFDLSMSSECGCVARPKILIEEISSSSEENTEAVANQQHDKTTSGGLSTPIQAPSHAQLTVIEEEHVNGHYLMDDELDSPMGTIPPPGTPKCTDQYFTPHSRIATPIDYQIGTLAPPSTPLHQDEFPNKEEESVIHDRPRRPSAVDLTAPRASSLLRHVLKNNEYDQTTTSPRNRKGLRLVPCSVPNMPGGLAPPCTPIPGTPVRGMGGLLPPETPTSQRMPRAPYSSPARPTSSACVVDPVEAIAASTRMFNSNAMIHDTVDPCSIGLPPSDDEGSPVKEDLFCRLDSGLMSIDLASFKARNDDVDLVHVTELEPVAKVLDSHHRAWA